MVSSKFRKQLQPVVTTLFVLALAFIATYPAFSGHYFAINNDGSIHLARLESLYQAFKAGRLPSLVNFIGFGNQGVAMNAMYPWLTMMIYVIPRFILHNPMSGLAAGFLIMNIITTVNTYWLAKYLGRNRLIIWLGVITYQFNAYHFQLMYTRVALGEAFGYAFLPLVMLGMFKIWNHEKNGIILLALGMSLVANSHVLSLVMFAGLIIIFEIIRLVFRKITFSEVKSLFAGAGLALLMASYSLYNVVSWMLHNKMVSPTPTLYALDPAREFTKIITNDISESAIGAHMGIALMLIMLFLVGQLLVHAKGSWQYWIIGATTVFVLAQNWFQSEALINTPAMLIQFTMRFITIVAVCVSISLILYLNQINWHSRPAAIFMSLVVVAIGLAGVIHFHSQNKTDYQWAQTHQQPNNLVQRRDIRHLTRKNYYRNVNLMTLPDYHMKKLDGTQDIASELKKDPGFGSANRLNKATVNFDNRGASKFKATAATDQSVSFTYHQKKSAKTVKLPVIGYNNVNYQIKVNGRSVTYRRSQGQLKVKVPKGHSKIVVSIANNSRHGWVLLITFLTYVVALMLLGLANRSKLSSEQS
ncbi:hypothetical protein [Lactiplantibacillus herbarum]|uniref:hypothetical protein n=1 Tax=Lactiplantibacillus herbarum TaxID=1670446 RepID=UPI00064F97C5|nr:hypothetical protein [Lactiplantibacillus herbarum]